ncbi:MAG: hypothetical protein DCC68_15810 [Planctomycetota bacterium]|nr:MAG: hypothetical protein DCC68_15810 [Planctomycetota bacterium]
MFARPIRKLLSVAVVAFAAFAAVNFASPSQANADPGGRGRGHYGHSHGHAHGHSHGHYNNYYRGPHGGHGHYSHYGYGHYHSTPSFGVQIAPPIRYYDNYYPGYYRSYVRPGISLSFGW